MTGGWEMSRPRRVNNPLTFSLSAFLGKSGCIQLEKKCSLLTFPAPQKIHLRPALRRSTLIFFKGPSPSLAGPRKQIMPVGTINSAKERGEFLIVPSDKKMPHEQVARIVR
jgi:hypothetical protein